MAYNKYQAREESYKHHKPIPHVMKVIYQPESNNTFMTFGALSGNAIKHLATLV